MNSRETITTNESKNMKYALLLKTGAKWFPIALDYDSKERAERAEQWQNNGSGERDTHKVCSLKQVKALLERGQIDFEGFTEKATKEKIDLIEISTNQ